LTITCGIDWAENHHDVALVNPAGKLVAKRRISDGVTGYRRLLELLAEAGDGAEEPIPVAVETARGLLIACLRATGRKVYSINPMAVARYRERHTVARAKSDHADGSRCIVVALSAACIDPPEHDCPAGCRGGTQSGHGVVVARGLLSTATGTVSAANGRRR
jgi:hypothetical protein